jgi:hypothetical protein
LYASDDALRPTVRVFDDDFDGVHAIGCATSSRAAAACYSGQLVTQHRVDPFQECGTQGR